MGPNRALLVRIVVLSLLVVGTVVSNTVNAAIADRVGQVTVLAVGSETPGPPFRMQPLLAHAVLDGGDVASLVPESGEHDSVALTGKQQRLARGELPPGLYRELRLVLAITTPGDPESDDPAPRIEEFEVSVAGDFPVHPGEITTVLIDWDLARTFDADGAPSATAFNLRRPDETVRRLALYVTDEEAGQVIAVNRATDQVFAVIQVGERPRGLAATSDGRRVYVANSGGDSISVIDPRTHQIVDTLPLRAGSRPEDVLLAMDDRRLVVSCPGVNVLAVYEPFSNVLIGEIELSRSPGRLARTPDERTVYTLLPDGSQMAAIDVTRITDPPRLVPVDAKPVDLAVNPLTGKIFVTHEGSPSLTVYTAELRRQEDLQIGLPSYGIALERGGSRLYITGGSLGGVALVASDIGAVARRWRARRAGFIAVDPDGRKLFTAGGRRGTLVILDRVAGKRIDEITVGESAYDLLVVP